MGAEISHCRVGENLILFFSPGRKSGQGIPPPSGLPEKNSSRRWAIIKFIKPSKLKQGSRVAVLSPSWGGPARFPGIYEQGIGVIEEVLGLNVVEYPTARMEGETLYRDPRRRAEDINRAFSDENIDAIMATIGGEDSLRILEYLDVQTILSNPKIIMGFSDTVTVLNYLNYRGLITFHGPTIMAGWAQVGNFDFLPEYYEKLLMGNQAGAEIRPFPQCSSGYPDWKEPNRLGEVLDKRENTTGFRWLQGKEKTNGFLWGGCLEVLLMLKGTRFWPEQDFWEGRILMLETSEEKPPPALMGCFLRTLGVEGILGKLAGIFLGRPRDYSSAEKETLYEIVQKVVVEEFKEKDLNIVANMDFGHTDPNLILPLGSQVEIAPEERKIRFTESFFQESN